MTHVLTRRNNRAARSSTPLLPRKPRRQPPQTPAMAHHSRRLVASLPRKPVQPELVQVVETTLSIAEMVLLIASLL
jgi:hypothetical protein